MSKVVTKNKPCLDTTKCGSSDARQIYDSGSSFCFSCQTFFPKGYGEAKENTEPAETEFTPTTNVTRKDLFEEIKGYPTKEFADRKIDKEINELYDVKVTHGSNGKIDAHYYPYKEGYKIRTLPKTFEWLGKSGGLFGKDLFNGGGKRLTICEGEIDTLSMAQASYNKYKKAYPIIGLSSSGATKELLKERDWIRTFDSVVLCFDNDEAGKKATKEATKIIGIDKVLIARMTSEDVNETFLRKGWQEVMRNTWDAQPHIPDGIVTKEALWDSLVEYNNKVSFPYPNCLEGLNTKFKGMRTGEITLFVSGTGSGKSTLLREVMLHILETSGDKIGIVELEESPAETARKLAGMSLERNPAYEEIPLEELKSGFDKVFGEDKIILLDHQGSMSDTSIVDQLEYMALSGCKYLFIDHITILVSEGVDNLQGLEAQDRVMNDLLRLVKRHDVWIGLVSHLRKVQVGATSFEEGRLPTLDDIRGSGSLKQIAFDIVAFARSMSAPSEEERNTIKIRSLKCRFSGLTGDTKSAFYNFKTGRVLQAEKEFCDKTFTQIG